ncbi:hypothetical protein [Bacillus piscicola]|uniref:hypothetical protein n=1 Tax=Bacillus piscicola TaxID=1632684 RepID=UPI001F091C2D|nr:hypothetical protein [Bacillus piscicola]
MIKNTIRVLIVLGTIVSALLLPKKAYKTFLPVTLFSTACQLAEILYFSLHKLWKVKGGPGVLMCNASILVVGPYFFSNLWAFHLTRESLSNTFMATVTVEKIVRIQ